MSHPYSFGLEEEYFLVDAQSKSVARAMPDGFLQEAKDALDGKVAGEFLQSQIEIITPPHTDMAAAQDELRSLRRRLGEIAGRHGLALFAAGTHPTASWERARQSEGARYDNVMDDLQMIGQRNMLCGLHVHVELPAPDRRVDVMNRMLPFLPLFIALSTSSPFWRSYQTGLKGYRLAAYDELPRTGIPELFRTNEEYDAYINALVAAGVMPDSSYIWWAIRPSLKHPTLELRAPDCCTRLDDAIAIAALYRSLARRLTRDPWKNWDLTAVSRAIIVENKWRAQRYGMAGTFVKIEGDGAIAVGDFVDQVVHEVTPDARALGCLAELEHCRVIAERGTSADMQIRLYEEFASHPEHGLKAVAEWIAATTLQ
ncbi:MAG: carboxylate-amine ligase [Pseudorhodoplanes sp.]